MEKIPGEVTASHGFDEVEFLRDSEGQGYAELDETQGSFTVIGHEDVSDNENNNYNYATFVSPPRVLTPRGTPVKCDKNAQVYSESKLNNNNNNNINNNKSDTVTPSPNGGRFSSSSWFNSLSRSKRKDKQRTPKNKKSLTGIFDASINNCNNNSGKKKLNLSDWEIPKTTPIPRANSASNDKRPLRLTGGSNNAVNLINSTSAAEMSTINLAHLEFRSEQIINSGSCGDLIDDHDGLEEDLEDDCFEGEENERSGNTRFNYSRRICNVGGSPHPQAYYTIDTKRLASRHKKSIREKKLLYGIKQFNLEPKRGMAYLMEYGFLEEGNAKSVASFLYREGRLSKKMIGQYLGDHHEFNQKVLLEFVSCHEFTHLILVQALRQFLWSFRLPGEAMQIDRIMEAFAAHYCKQNPDLFDEVDTCYILSFSIIMLNTALHNPNIRQKLTLAQFIKQNKGINSGKDLPHDILELIYRNIKEEPFKIPKETYDDLMYTFFSPEKEGWLLKQGGSWKNWKRRWFVLSDKCLYYFQHTAENVPKGIIPLENVKVRSLDDKDGKLYCFELYSDSNSVVKGCKTDSRGTVVQGNHRVYRMSAGSPEERENWVQCIRDSIKEHPFYDIIASKKLALRRKSLKTQQQLQQQLLQKQEEEQKQQRDEQKPASNTIATSTTTLVQQAQVVETVRSASTTSTTTTPPPCAYTPVPSEISEFPEFPEAAARPEETEDKKEQQEAKTESEPESEPLTFEDLNKDQTQSSSQQTGSNDFENENDEELSSSFGGFAESLGNDDHTNNDIQSQHSSLSNKGISNEDDDDDDDDDDSFTSLNGEQSPEGQEKKASLTDKKRCRC